MAGPAALASLGTRCILLLLCAAFIPASAGIATAPVALTSPTATVPWNVAVDCRLCTRPWAPNDTSGMDGCRISELFTEGSFTSFARKPLHALKLSLPALGSLCLAPCTSLQLTSTHRYAAQWSRHRTGCAWLLTPCARRFA